MHRHVAALVAGLCLVAGTAAAEAPAPSRRSRRPWCRRRSSRSTQRTVTSPACRSGTPPRPGRSSCATARTSRAPASATSPTTNGARPGAAADHVRLQRRPRLVLGVAAHGGARSPAGRTGDAATTPPPPYRLVDNAYSILDSTDLVMIDPVGTGSPGPLGDAKDKDFWASTATSSRSPGSSPSTSARTAAGTRPSTCSARATARRARPASSTGYRRRRHGVQRRDPGLAGARHRRDLRRSPATTCRTRCSFRPTPRRAWYHKAAAHAPPGAGSPFLDEGAHGTRSGEYSAGAAEGTALLDAASGRRWRRSCTSTPGSRPTSSRGEPSRRGSPVQPGAAPPARETVGRLDSRFLGTEPSTRWPVSQYDPRRRRSRRLHRVVARLLQRGVEGRLRARPTDRLDETWKIWDFKHQSPARRSRIPGSRTPAPTSPTR